MPGPALAAITVVWALFSCYCVLAILDLLSGDFSWSLTIGPVFGMLVFTLGGGWLLAAMWRAR